MAFAPNSPTRTLFVRALLDGVAGTPADTQFTGDDTVIARSYAMNFVFTPVAAGAHTVQMQFRSSNGQTVFVNRGTTIVDYK
jgi:hypothetical protein